MAKKELVKNDLLTVRVDPHEPLEKLHEVSTVTGEIFEHAVDAVEEGIDHVETIIRNNPLVLAGVAVVGLAVGGYIGYRIGAKRTTLKYEDILREEIAAAKEFYSRVNKEGEYETPQSAAAALHVPDEVIESVRTYQGSRPVGAKIPYNNPSAMTAPPVPVETESVMEVTNVFTEHADEPLKPLEAWDYDRELALRNPNNPYVISSEEHTDNGDNHEQVTLTYYPEDDVLVDERDEIIDNVNYVVGDDNLLRFGHGSGDRNVVYVRNERLSMDYEIVRSRGSYAREVLGVDPEPKELRHSARREARRRRGTDE